jgi:G:T-mismatch repair DNA endonuclease (very short patch repair protein)
VGLELAGSNTYKPKTNISFWQKKFYDTVQRDQKNQQLLNNLGWKVHTIWECEAKEDERLFLTLSNILGQLD